MSLPVPAVAIGLLIASNAFPTVARHGHPNHGNRAAGDGDRARLVHLP
ncbi:DMT family protein [Paracoccus siganidrum]|nr:DMT family protein [Paracoccus siganidrum]